VCVCLCVTADNDTDLALLVASVHQGVVSLAAKNQPQTAQILTVTMHRQTIGWRVVELRTWLINCQTRRVHAAVRLFLSQHNKTQHGSG